MLSEVVADVISSVKIENAAKRTSNRPLLVDNDYVREILISGGIMIIG